MSLIVVDASVAVKWFVPEVHAVEARHWRNGPDELHAPAFFFDLEIANILLRGRVQDIDRFPLLGLECLPLLVGEFDCRHTGLWKTRLHYAN